jgi:hypothetical protein
MICIEKCEPEKERSCDECEEAEFCPYLGTSPLVFSDDSQVKCIVIDKRSTSISMLIPTQVKIAKSGKIECYQVSVHCFRQGRFWRRIRGWFA